MTTDQQPDPSRLSGVEPPATPPPPSLPAGGRGTPLPGSVPAWPAGAPAPGPWAGYGAPLPWPPPPVPLRQRNGTGVAALVLGVLGASVCWTYFLSPLGLALGALAVAFGLIGSGRAKRGAASNRPVALGGLWTGAGAALVGAVLTTLLLVDVLRVTEVDSAAGSDYLAEPGDEVVFADGLVVTLARPRPGGTAHEVLLTVTVDNRTDGFVTLDDELRALDDGEMLPRDYVARVPGAAGEVAPGEVAEVEYRVSLDPGMTALAVDYRPADAYAWGYWFVFLPAERESERPPAEPDDEGPPGTSLDV
ncbi:DUF4190 domain-containing protein [Streptomyces sp. DSM 44915]|uniref:DUF4190 domain-containing protein n=1 Tax=Streptomyces chisholmiae TaxID=3075540 RepID=A0ABU2JWH1_9ACTN|nr:DUF4190 domain-containing protein [Streptomyces sp. DSM 44915]MDT0269312.1 DUF4190 domain-containing protein [Streptomyces sp. DSM 44915]